MRNLKGARLAAVALAFAGFGAIAHAAGGYNVTQRQESLVQPAMSVAEVTAALGRPYRQMTYRNTPGPTFSYRVVDTENMLFEVAFDANGKVATAGERMDPLLR